MDVPPKTSLNSDNIFFGMEFKGTTTSTITVALLAVIVGVALLLPYATNVSEVLHIMMKV